MKKAKRIAAILLSVAILFCTVTISFSASPLNELTIDEYSEALHEMISTYSDSEITSNAKNSTDKVTLANRLIVKTSTNASLENSYGAIETIEGYDCLHIMQYRDAVSTQKAFDFYEKQDVVTYVEFDFYFSPDETSKSICSYIPAPAPGIYLGDRQALKQMQHLT